jgi:hypothetical protein
MNQLKTSVRTYIDRLCRLFKLTPKETVMWIEVPMSCNSVEQKNKIMLSTLNHMEQTIKIK